MTEFHFWADVMLIQPRIYASRASPAQKFRGLFIPKTFQGPHFLFSGELIWLIELFARETNLEKKVQCGSALLALSVKASHYSSFQASQTTILCVP